MSGMGHPGLNTDESQYLYFVQVFGYGYSGLFKVGVSKNWEQRLGQLRAGPFPICAVFVLKLDGAFDLEQRMLHHFRRYHIRHEWFQVLGEGGPQITLRENMQSLSRNSKDFIKDVHNFLAQYEAEWVVS